MEDYNEWKNYPTGALAHWIDKTWGDYRYWWEQARKALREGSEDEAVAAISQDLETMVTDIDNRPVREGFFGDVLGWALQSIDYYEVAQHIVEGAKY